MNAQAHGSMASFTSTESSYSDLDDIYARSIRQRLRQNRGPVERALADVITGAFINMLSSLTILTTSEASRIKSKPSGQSKSASLVDTVLRKTGTDIKNFVDALKDRCKHVYDMLRLNEYDTTSSIQESSSFLTTDVDLIEHQAQRVASWLERCIEDALCSIPRFHKDLMSIISSGLDLALLTFDTDLTLLHKLVAQDRYDLLKCVQYTGQWTSLCELRIDSNNRKYARQTPLTFAMTLNRFKCHEIIEKNNSVERALDPIAKYVRRKDLRRFKEMRRTSPQKLRYTSEDGLTLLDYACQSGSEEMVVEVIKAEREIRFNREDVDNATRVCVELGYSHLLKHLKNYSGYFRPDQVMLDNKHVIERTAFNGDFESYKELKRLGASATKSVFSLAVSQNRIEFARSVLQEDPVLLQTVEFQDRRKKTPAHFAAEKGFDGIFPFMFQLNIDPLKTDKRGYNILHSAASHGSVEVTRLIVEYADSLNVKWRLLKAKDQYLGSERIFLVRGHDNSRSAWHYVEAERAVIDIFRKKTRGGAVDVAQYGTVVSSGWGPNPPYDVVKNVEERYDMTKMSPTSPPDLQPLHVALVKNHAECALYLISVMDDVNETDCFGLTPLHLAAMRGNREIIEALLAKGASPSSRDHQGRTPEDVARINEYTEVVDLLKLQPSPDPALARLREHLEGLLSAISDDKVSEQRRTRGQERATIYIRDNLREAQAEINDYLYELGAGPVASETL